MACPIRVWSTGLSDPPSADEAATVADPDAAALKTLKTVVTMLKLRTFHLVLQGSSARVGIKFARELRARVRCGLALCMRRWCPGTPKGGYGNLTQFSSPTPHAPCATHCTLPRKSKEFIGARNRMACPIHVS